MVNLDAALGPVLRDVSRTSGVQLNVRWEWMANDETYAVRALADGVETGFVVEGRVPSQELVVALADQLQEVVIENRWGRQRESSWPMCPQHPHGHPLRPVLADEPIWQCPMNATIRYPIGELSINP